MRCRTPAGSADTSSPATRAVPLVGASRLVSIFRVVDLPAPFGPRKATSSPGATSRSTPRTASTVSLPTRNVRVSFSVWIIRFPIPYVVLSYILYAVRSSSHNWQDASMTTPPGDPAEWGTPEGRAMIELLWDPPAPPSRGPRQRLSLEKVVDAAIDLAASEGIDGLSMRALASRLGCGRDEPVHLRAGPRGALRADDRPRLGLAARSRTPTFPGASSSSSTPTRPGRCTTARPG